VGRPETYNWHFVDIPVEHTATSYDESRDCQLDPAKGDCVIHALDREVPKISDTALTPIPRAEAVKFVTHFIGDLHQPLHCSDRNGDKGANDVKVTFFGQKVEPGFHSKWNLHAVWDAGLIDHAGRTQAAYVTKLESWIAHQNVSALESGTPTDWANEAHTAGVEHSYKNPGKSTDFPATGGKVGKPYYDANISVVDQQLAKAGVRLANVLNDALDSNHCSARAPARGKLALTSAR
jgi:hypothetical protein